MVHEKPSHANRHVLVCQAIMVFAGGQMGSSKNCYCLYSPLIARLLNMNVIISNDFTVC